MRKLLQKERWSPFWVGSGIGVLSWITFAFMDKALGVSTTFVRAAAALEGLAAPGHVYSNAYFAKYVGTPEAPKPVFEWQFALVVLLVAGAFLSARWARSSFREQVPALWEWRFGPSRAKRYGMAFLGGVILLFGARLAGGCTSGHGISGGLQLSASSWVFILFMFGAGVLTARILYGKGGGDHV